MSCTANPHSAIPYAQGTPFGPSRPHACTRTDSLDAGTLGGLCAYGNGDKRIGPQSSGASITVRRSLSSGDNHFSAWMVSRPTHTRRAQEVQDPQRSVSMTECCGTDVLFAPLMALNREAFVATYEGAV